MRQRWCAAREIRTASPLIVSRIYTLLLNIYCCRPHVIFVFVDLLRFCEFVASDDMIMDYAEPTKSTIPLGSINIVSSSSTCLSSLYCPSLAAPAVKDDLSRDAQYSYKGSSSLSNAAASVQTHLVVDLDALSFIVEDAVFTLRKCMWWTKHFTNIGSTFVGHSPSWRTGYKSVVIFVNDDDTLKSAGNWCQGDHAISLWNYSVDCGGAIVFYLLGYTNDVFWGLKAWSYYITWQHLRGNYHLCIRLIRT